MRLVANSQLLHNILHVVMRIVSRIGYGTLALCWILFALWTWTGSSETVILWGAPIAFMIGAFSPIACCFIFALLFPWFGTNPGVPYLSMIDFALMGTAATILLMRAKGTVIAKRTFLDYVIILFVFYAWFGLIPVWRWVLCDLQFAGLARGPAILMTHFATAPAVGFQMTIRLTLAVTLYAWMRDQPWPIQRIKYFWYCLFAGIGIALLIGWPVYLGWIPIGWWREENSWITQFGYQRLQSVYGHSGWLAQHIELIAPMSLALAIVGPSASKHNLFGLLAIFFFISQLFTLQRAGWIALACAYLVVGILLYRTWNPHGRINSRPMRRVILSMVIFITIALIIIFTPILRMRLQQITETSHRTPFWSVAIELWKDSPITGGGIGGHFNKHQRFIAPSDPRYGPNNLTAHSLYLNLLSERGIIGLSLFAIIIITLLIRVTHKRNENPSPPIDLMYPLGLRFHTEPIFYKTLRAGIAGGLIAILIDGIFQYVFYLAIIEVMFWMLASMTTWISERQPNNPINTIKASSLTALIALALLATTLFTHRHVFDPWVALVEGDFYLVGSKVTKIPLPPNLNQVTMDIAPFNLGIGEQSPITATFNIGDTQLTQLTLYQIKKYPVLLNLPQDRSPETPLTVTFSSGFPARSCSADWPFIDAGLLYTPPHAPGSAVVVPYDRNRLIYFGKTAFGATE